jgi:hypothetical protein
VNRLKAAVLAALVSVGLAACAQANESGKNAAGCKDAQSYVRSKAGLNGQGHWMMLVWCRPGDTSSTWYVTWNKDQKSQYDKYKVGDVYPK